MSNEITFTQPTPEEIDRLMAQARIERGRYMVGFFASLFSSSDKKPSVSSKVAPSHGLAAS